MRRKFPKALLVFFFFVSTLINLAHANAKGDSSHISLQVVVSESAAMQYCGYNFTSNAMSFSHKSSSGCGYNSENLLDQARELTSQKITHFDSMQIVTLTVTAP